MFKIHIKFVNKGLDFIKIRRIIKCDEVTSLLPSCISDNDKIPSVLHKLEPTICNKIFNYRQTIDEINFSDATLLDTNVDDCDCKDSPFVDPSSQAHCHW